MNDADRLAVDPAMRAIVDRRNLAGTDRIDQPDGPLETAWLTHESNPRR